MQMFNVSSNLINLFLRQSKNVNQSSATNTGSGTPLSIARIIWKHILHIENCFIFLPSFATVIQTKTSYLSLHSWQQKLKNAKK